MSKYVDIRPKVKGQKKKAKGRKWQEDGKRINN
jgi:hypothetical protein